MCALRKHEEKEAGRDQDQVRLKNIYVHGRLGVMFICVPMKTFVRPLFTPDEYHHRSITSLGKESAAKIEARSLEISNGSDTAISRSCFSWDLML